MRVAFLGCKERRMLYIKKGCMQVSTTNSWDNSDKPKIGELTPEHQVGLGRPNLLSHEIYCYVV
jgi:hypothetical protein